MELTIFGATGGTGECLVVQALAAGHKVTAVVRDPNRLAVASRTGLHVLTADVMDPVAILPAVRGADAVVSAIGPRGRGPTSISADSAHSIITAMEKTGARRLITISGSIVDDTGNGIFMRQGLKRLARRTFLREVCADMRAAENEVRASVLDWTIVRPPRLTNKAGNRAYRVAINRNVARGVTIGRADLAGYILGILQDPQTVGKHIFLAN